MLGIPGLPVMTGILQMPGAPGITEIRVMTEMTGMS